MVVLTYEDPKQTVTFTATPTKKGQFEAVLKADPPFKVGVEPEDQTGMLRAFLNIVTGQDIK